MRGLNSIKQQLAEAIQLLEDSGLHEQAQELASHCPSLEEGSDRVHALTSIAGLCHIRAFGDLNVPSSPGWSWSNRLGKLEARCRKLIRALDENT